MSAAVGAHNLRPLHAETRVRVSRHRAGEAVEVRRPAAAGLELVVCFVQGCVTGSTGVDARAGHVLVVLAGEGRFGALFAEDPELFCVRVRIWCPTVKGRGRLGPYLCSKLPSTHHWISGRGTTSCLTWV